MSDPQAQRLVPLLALDDDAGQPMMIFHDRRRDDVAIYAEDPAKRATGLRGAVDVLDRHTDHVARATAVFQTPRDDAAARTRAGHHIGRLDGAGDSPVVQARELTNAESPIDADAYNAGRAQGQRERMDMAHAHDPETVIRVHDRAGPDPDVAALSPGHHPNGDFTIRLYDDGTLETEETFVVDGVLCSADSPPARAYDGERAAPTGLREIAESIDRQFPNGLQDHLRNDGEISDIHLTMTGATPSPAALRTLAGNPDLNDQLQRHTDIDAGALEAAQIGAQNDVLHQPRPQREATLRAMAGASHTGFVEAHKNPTLMPSSHGDPPDHAMAMTGSVATNPFDGTDMATVTGRMADALLSRRADETLAHAAAEARTGDANHLRDTLDDTSTPTTTFTRRDIAGLVNAQDKGLNGMTPTPPGTAAGSHVTQRWHDPFAGEYHRRTSITVARAEPNANQAWNADTIPDSVMRDDTSHALQLAWQEDGRGRLHTPDDVPSFTAAHLNRGPDAAKVHHKRQSEAGLNDEQWIRDRQRSNQPTRDRAATDATEAAARTPRSDRARRGFAMDDSI